MAFGRRSLAGRFFAGQGQRPFGLTSMAAFNPIMFPARTAQTPAETSQSDHNRESYSVKAATGATQDLASAGQLYRIDGHQEPTSPQYLALFGSMVASHFSPVLSSRFQQVSVSDLQESDPCEVGPPSSSPMTPLRAFRGHARRIATINRPCSQEVVSARC